jgi:hypothetical protein
MWGSSNHTAVRVRDIDKFSDSENTSLYQSQQNDWAEKIIYPVNDQNYVDKKWIQNAGYLADKKDSVAAFFKNYHDTVGFEQILESDIIRQISLQGFLKSITQPYVFVHARPYTKFKRFQHLYQLFDWNNFYQDHTLLQIAKQNHELMDPHIRIPNSIGQKKYAELLSLHLLKRFAGIFENS